MYSRAYFTVRDFKKVDFFTIDPNDFDLTVVIHDPTDKYNEQGIMLAFDLETIAGIIRKYQEFNLKAK